MTKRTYANKDGVERKQKLVQTDMLSYDAPFVGYVNVELTDAQKEGYVKWADSASFWEAFAFHIGDGVNISIKWEAKNEVYLASGTQRRTTSVNAGLVVTARSQNPFHALGRLLFTLVFLSHKERWKDEGSTTTHDRW